MAGSGPSQRELDLKLLDAVRDGSPRDAQAHITAGASVGGSSQPGLRPLMLATIAGNSDMVRALIASGADLDAGLSCHVGAKPDKLVVSKGARAIHCAIISRQLEILSVLLNFGADPNAADVEGSTPLMVACEGSENADERAQMASALLTAGADATLADKTNCVALHIASFFGHIEIVDILLLMAPKTLNMLNADGSTPLCSAALGGQTHVVSKLLSTGAVQRNSSPGYHECPLVVAVEAGDAAMVRVLLEEGLNAIGGAVSVVPYALYSAVTGGRASIVHMLIASEGEAKQGHWARHDYYGMPMLHHASEYAFGAVVAVLLAGGANEDDAPHFGPSAYEVIGSRVPEGEGDPRQEINIFRMLQRGPAFRARSWAWPAQSDAGVIPLLSRGEQSRCSGIRTFRTKERGFFVRAVGR